MRKKNGGEKKLPDALLATTEDKEHCCVIKTVLSTDSFILLGTSEQVKETKRGSDGRLKSIVIGTPAQPEKGLVGVVVRHIVPDTRCSCCESEVHQDTVVFISVTTDRNGRPKTHLSLAFSVPVSGVSISISDGAFVDLVTPAGKFTTNFRKSYESCEHIWYISPHKMFCFLARPSLDFLTEAAKSLYFERLVLRYDDWRQQLMEETSETEDIEQALESTRRMNEKYRERIEAMELEFAGVEDEMTEICREQDEESEAHEEVEEAWIAEREKLLEVIEDLELRLDQALCNERELSQLVSEAYSDFPALFPLLLRNVMDEAEENT
ncbi:MAG: hypothetical protein Greene101415_202 [Parcubacteria group bacterium Greene1014_15]|nr:MAG: hypothetical protein Greene101415_202 [Parcubacteria group bacterium Greene1014_15]